MWAVVRPECAVQEARSVAIQQQDTLVALEVVTEAVVYPDISASVLGVRLFLSVLLYQMANKTRYLGFDFYNNHTPIDVIC